MTGIIEKSDSYEGIVGLRLSRRAALMGLASTAALLATPAMSPKSANAAGSSLSFAELTRRTFVADEVQPGERHSEDRHHSFGIYLLGHDGGTSAIPWR